MEWLIGISVVALVVYLRTTKRVTRRGVIRMGALATVVIALGTWQAIHRDGREASERGRAAAAIRADEIALDGLRLSQCRAGSCVLTGRVENRSIRTITGIGIAVTAYECPDRPRSRGDPSLGFALVVSPAGLPACDVVGQDASVWVAVMVPPGQARTIEGFAHFVHMPWIGGTFVWTYAVTGVNAR